MNDLGGSAREAAATGGGLAMTGESGSNGVPPTSSDEEFDPLLRDPNVLSWTGEHLAELRRSAYGQRVLYQSLAVGFVLGLAAHVGGYLLRPSPPSEPLGLVADLLYALGFALWTGVVVVLFVQVVPELKKRQFKAWLDAYEATREKARVGTDQASGDDGAPRAK
jgi:hypothetical protein